LNFLVGKMMRGDKEGRMDPKRAIEVLKNVIEGFKEGGGE
jgi:Asp-tRNA(Asn)/Glu-tRNA(Gln) amidotransferase B subunit